MKEFFWVVIGILIVGFVALFVLLANHTLDVYGFGICAVTFFVVLMTLIYRDGVMVEWALGGTIMCYSMAIVIDLTRCMRSNGGYATNTGGVILSLVGGIFGSYLLAAGLLAFWKYANSSR